MITSHTAVRMITSLQRCDGRRLADSRAHIIAASLVREAGKHLPKNSLPVS